MTRISLGAGQEIEKGWVNVDLLDLPGIDVVHNLMEFPYPFESETADYIKAKDLIEHLPSYVPNRVTPPPGSYKNGINIGKGSPLGGPRIGQPTIIAFIEEVSRILKPGGTLWIQTPRFDADFLWIDPTHVRGFHERSFEFFDPEQDFGKSTGFYSEAKFRVEATKLENRNLQFEMVKR